MDNLQADRRRVFQDTSGSGVTYPAGFVGCISTFSGTFSVQYYLLVKIPLVRLEDLDQGLHPGIFMFDNTNNRCTIKFDGNYQFILRLHWDDVLVGPSGFKWDSSFVAVLRKNNQAINLLGGGHQPQLDGAASQGPSGDNPATFELQQDSIQMYNSLVVGDFFELWCFIKNGGEGFGDPDRRTYALSAHLSCKMLKV